MSAKMNTSRMTAIIVGVLYITATVASSLSLILSKPILDASDYLSKVSENEKKNNDRTTTYMIYACK